MRATFSDSVTVSHASVSEPSLGRTMPTSRFAADFEQVILPHLNSAYNLARWLLGDDGDAQDVVHDSFLRAHRYFDSFDGSDGRAWLLGIVRNACFTLLRGKKGQQSPRSTLSKWHLVAIQVLNACSSSKRISVHFATASKLFRLNTAKS